MNLSILLQIHFSSFVGSFFEIVLLVLKFIMYKHNTIYSRIVLIAVILYKCDICITRYSTVFCYFCFYFILYHIHSLNPIFPICLVLPVMYNFIDVFQSCFPSLSYLLCSFLSNVPCYSIIRHSCM